MIKHKTIIIILFCLAFIFLFLGFILAYYNQTLFLPTSTSVVQEDYRVDNFWPEIFFTAANTSLNDKVPNT